MLEFVGFSDTTALVCLSGNGTKRSTNKSIALGEQKNNTALSRGTFSQNLHE